MLLQTVNWSCLLISVTKVHWRVQPTAARRSGRFNKMHGLCAHCMCLSTIPPWKLSSSGLKMDSSHLITPNLNGMEISCLGSDAWSYFETFIRSPEQFLNQKSHHEEDMGHFLQVQLMKLSWALQVVWQEYVDGDGRHSKYLSLLKRVFALTAFSLSWIVETIFDNVSAATLPWRNAA